MSSILRLCSLLIPLCLAAVVLSDSATSPHSIGNRAVLASSEDGVLASFSNDDVVVRYRCFQERTWKRAFLFPHVGVQVQTNSGHQSVSLLYVTRVYRRSPISHVQLLRREPRRRRRTSVPRALRGLLRGLVELGLALAVTAHPQRLTRLLSGGGSHLPLRRIRSPLQLLRNAWPYPRRPQLQFAEPWQLT